MRTARDGVYNLIFDDYMNELINKIAPTRVDA